MKKLMLLDQVMSSLTSFLIPILVITFLGEYAMVKFTYVQSFGVYIVAILNSLFVMPYLFVSKNDKNNKGFDDDTLKLFAFIIAVFSCIMLYLSREIGHLFVLYFLHNLLKEIIRTISLNNNSFEKSLLFQIIPLFTASIIFLIWNDFGVALVSYIFCSNLVALLMYYSIKFQFDIEYLKEGMTIGKWSVLNMLVQLIITQIILNRIGNISQNSIIIYGVIINILGVFNPILSFLNNYSLKDLRAEKSKEAKFVVYNRNVFRYVITISLLICLMHFLFSPICEYFYHQNYDKYALVFLALSVSLIFTAIAQLNSRLLTLYSQRRVVFETALCSLLAVSLGALLIEGDWIKHLVIYFGLSRFAGWCWSQYKINKLRHG